MQFEQVNTQTNTTHPDHPNNEKQQYLARREAAKAADIEVIASAVKQKKAWPVRSAGLLKAFARAYRDSPVKAEAMLERVLNEVRERIPTVERLLLPDQHDIGDCKDGVETRIVLPRGDWFRREPRVQLVNPGAFWQVLREHREVIDSAYAKRQRENKPAFNGDAARERAAKLMPVPKFMRNGRRKSPLGNRTEDRHSVERRREQNRATRHSKQPKKGSENVKKEKK
ncbi:hypothetical protein HY413_03425 [Candidatus Kaiserbacteria bacterium]|nr:hypothetical protein [Candidatus Kaiserbacteria bacterium]